MKIVIFKSKYAYCDFMCEDLSSLEDIIVIEPVDLRKKPFTRFYLKMLSQLNTGKYYEEFLKTYLRSAIHSDEEVCFVSFDSSPTAQIDFSSIIKQKYPKSKSALIVYNCIENNDKKAQNYTNRFDMVFTFDPYDADKYGWVHFLGLMPTNRSNQIYNKDYDVTFIGNDKGRYSLIKEIYKEVSERGYNCFFYVISQIAHLDDIDDKLLHKEMMSFSDLIDIEKRSKCVLDITSVKNNKQGLSLRILEGIYSNSKIITNNAYSQEIDIVKDNSLYFRSISDFSNIDSLLDTPAHYHDLGRFSISNIINTISNSFAR